MYCMTSDGRSVEDTDTAGDGEAKTKVEDGTTTDKYRVRTVCIASSIELSTHPTTAIAYCPWVIVFVERSNCKHNAACGNERSLSGTDIMSKSHRYEPLSVCPFY